MQHFVKLFFGGILQKSRRETKYKPKAFKEKKRYVCFAIHSESYVYNCNFLKYDFLKNYNKC